MAERSKSHLKQEFRDGERPTGTDFGDLIDSFITKIDDAVNVDANSNLDIPGGVNLGNPVAGVAGTIRFNAGNVQVFDGGTWNNIGGGSGAFTPVLGGPSVAFAGGNVGIGTFAAAPTHKLEIPLAANTSALERVKFGNAVISNGQGTAASNAQFAHTDQAGVSAAFALRQTPAGATILNAAANQPLTLSVGGTATTPRIFLAPTGPVVINSNTVVPGSAGEPLQLNGEAFKTGAKDTWTVVSDARYKKDVSNFNDGLDKLLKVRTVKFKYDGIDNYSSGDKEEIGIIGQEMKEIFPYMVNSIGTHRNDATAKSDEVLTYNSSALTYVMVNAIQELAAKVQELEAQLAEERSRK